MLKQRNILYNLLASLNNDLIFEEKTPMCSRGGFFFVVVTILFISTTVKAQKKFERQVRRLETAADQMYESKLYSEALDMYLVLDSISPDNPEYPFRIGVIYYHSIDKAKSLNYFLDAIRNGKSDPNLDFYLARAYHFNLMFDSAVYYYEKSLDIPDSVKTVDKNQKIETDKYIRDCELAEHYIRNPLLTPIVNVGMPVNSIYPEYVPLVSANEDLIIFTSRRPNTTGGNMDQGGIYLEDIYISKKQRDGSWSDPTNDLIFNTPEHDACVGLNPDGTILFIYRSDNGGDLYISELIDQEWSEPIPIQGINTSNWESSACLTEDGQYLYFTSDKPGGYGGADIYKARKLENGKFGEIQNLGPEINTAFDEDAPQIHSDNKTLFFSSKGRNGLGGFDVYSSVYSAENDSWEKPRNIGYPINTPDDDIYFTLLANGTKGFFTSYRNDSYGEKDIYMISRPEAGPTKFLMKFNLYDPYNDQPIQAAITIENISTGEKVELIAENATNGKYNLALDFETDYRMGIRATGYKFKEKEIYLNYRADIFEYVMNIVPESDEVITLIDSIAYVTAVENYKVQYRIQNGDSFVKVKIIPRGEDEQEQVIVSGNITPKEEVKITPVNPIIDKDNTVAKKEDESSIIVDPNDNIDRGQNINDRLATSLKGNPQDINIKEIMKRKEGVILLSRLDNDQKVVIPTINFAFDSYEIRGKDFTYLNDLAGFLSDSKELIMILFGHTDIIGAYSYNKQLSGMRSNMVRYYLMQKGADKNRMVSRGEGSDFPIWSNESILGRQLNRRVNFYFIDVNDAKYKNHPYSSFLSDNNIPILPKSNYTSNIVVWEKLPVSAHFAVNHVNPITSYSSNKLELLTEFVKKYPMKLVIAGFEDKDQENPALNLSKRRAEAIFQYLIKRGISKEKLVILDKSDFSSIYDVEGMMPRIERRRVQFFLIRE